MVIQEFDKVNIHITENLPPTKRAKINRFFHDIVTSAVATL